MNLKFVSAPPCNPRRCLSTHYYQEEDDNTIRAKSDPGSGSPPLKRQRLVFDGVVVPTLAPVRKRKEEEDERDFKKLALLKNVRRFPITSICPIADQSGSRR